MNHANRGLRSQFQSAVVTNYNQQLNFGIASIKLKLKTFTKILKGIQRL